MCNTACIEFGKAYLAESDVRGKSVLEVGSLDINGSLRSIAEDFGPGSYIGVDIQRGPGVDVICDAFEVLDRFGPGTFDVLISTELLEHVRDWRRVISNFKQILRPNGVLLLTTRSKGFPFHDFPFDFWRFEKSDMQFLFSDFIIEAIVGDPLSPGVFVKARRPSSFTETDTTDYQLYSVIKGKRSALITDNDIYWFKVRYTIQQFLGSIVSFLMRIIKGKRK